MTKIKRDDLISQILAEKMKKGDSYILCIADRDHLLRKGPKRVNARSITYSKDEQYVIINSIDRTFLKDVIDFKQLHGRYVDYKWIKVK